MAALDHQRRCGQDRSAMLFSRFVPSLLLIAALCVPAFAQGFKKELDAPEKVSLSIKNMDGRVSVVASDEQQKKVTIDAKSTGMPVEPDDIKVETKGDSINIDVRPRGEKDRIDLVVTIPARSKVNVEGKAGAVDVVGSVESATVKTDTGTIHADVPLDALKFNFLWEASKPRYMSDVELPAIKEKAGGTYKLSGRLGDKKPDKEQLVALDFRTQRGVVLLNIDPDRAPADLRERPLTEAARAIVRSGDIELVEAIRKVSPKMFGDYAKTLPPPEKEPELVHRTAPGHIVSAVAPQLLRFNASVTDRQMLSKKLDEIDAGGGTALYDALGYVLSEPIKRLRGERTAIVVMSDGDDNKSFLPFPAILDALSESGALVYPLYVPSGLVPESSVPKPEITIDPLRTRYLTLTTRADEEGRKLAAASGGMYYPIRRIEDLQKAYDDVVAQLRSAYTITYASNSVSSSPRVRVRTNRDGASVRLSPVVELNTP